MTSNEYNSGREQVKALYQMVKAAYANLKGDMQPTVNDLPVIRKQMKAYQTQLDALRTLEASITGVKYVPVQDVITEIVRDMECDAILYEFVHRRLCALLEDMEQESESES